MAIMQCTLNPTSLIPMYAYMQKGNVSAPYYYATGAAYCFSSSLMAEMEIYIRCVVSVCVTECVYVSPGLGTVAQFVHACNPLQAEI